MTWGYAAHELQFKTGARLLLEILAACLPALREPMRDRVRSNPKMIESALSSITRNHLLQRGIAHENQVGMALATVLFG